MPISIGDKKYRSFALAQAAVKRAKPGVKNPAAYVAAIERKQHPPPKGKK